MTTYKTHWNSTYLEPIIICQEAWHEKVLVIAKQLVLIMGLDNYDRWCTENKEFPDGPVDWQKLHAILEEKYNQELACRQLEEQDHREQMREERPA
jgi:hypothetical protein